jgi:hypothetical protein
VRHRGRVEGGTNGLRRISRAGAEA